MESGAFLLVLLSSAPASPTSQPQDPASVELSFTVYSEALEPVSGARVKIEGDPAEPLPISVIGSVLTTDGVGHTSGTPSMVGARYDVHLKERGFPHGTLLGQSIPGYVVPPSTMDLSTCQVRLWETILTQPALRPVVIDSSAYRINHPEDVLWSIDMDELDHDTFQFPALVGSLSTADSVKAYAEYCNVVLLESNYRYALAIRTEEVESFGTHGAVITVDCSSFGFTKEPVVDLYFITTSAQFFGGTTLTIEGTNWSGDVLGLSLSGGVGIGTTLLLVRPDGGVANSLQEFVADPPDFGPTALHKGSGAALQAERCTPPEPAGAAEAECIPPAPPAHDPLCPAPTKVGPATVTSDVERVGPKVCGDGGPATEIGETLDWGASLSAKFNIKGVEITAGGSLKQTESVKTSTTPGSGSGCGECKQVYKIRAFCKQQWTKEVPSFGFFYPHAFKGCKDKKVTTGSVTEIMQESSCPMTGC